MASVSSAQSLTCSGGLSVGALSSTGTCEGPETGRAPAAPTDLTLTYAVGGTGIFATPGMFSHAFNNLAGATALGAIPLAGNANLLTGLDTDPTGTTVFAVAGFGAGNTQRLVTVNRTTGALTNIGNLTGLVAGAIVVGMATDPVSGQIFVGEFVTTAPQAMNLRSVDAATGATTLIGSMSATAIYTDLAINCQGQMFALNSVNDQLVSVNRTTAASTVVGALGFDTGNLVDGSGIDFDNNDGTLYGNLQTFVTGTGVTASRYGPINTTTGVATGVAAPTAIGKPAAITTCPAGATPPTFTYTPPAGSTVTGTGGDLVGSTSNFTITPAIGTAGVGTGAPATSTLTCTAPTAPFTGFGQTITATGPGAISGGPLTGTCTRGATAVTQTLTCALNRGGTTSAVSWTLNCPAGTTPPPPAVAVNASSIWSLIALMLALFGVAAVAVRRQG